MIVKVQKAPGAGGAFVVRLDSEGALLLRSLPARLREVLGRTGAGDRLLGRLFPPAYAHPEREAEYRRLLGDDLIRRKLECIDAFEKTLSSWKTGLFTVTVTIPPEEFELWLGFVNDMRLVLGIELDIRDESWETSFDPAHPQARDLALLHWLSWLEDELLRAHG